MAEIDVLLSASLKRAAQPGDAAGVADAIRSRIDAGDTGAPAAASGFGGSGVWKWLPWVGLVVVAGIVGTGVGAFGVLGAQVTEVAAAETVTLGAEATAYLCIGGDVAAVLPAGQRVLAVGRSADSSWLGLRDPLNISATLWVSAVAVAVDDGQDVAALPLGGACPEVVTTLAVPQAPVASTPTPAPGPADTTPPAIFASKWVPDPVYGGAAAPYCATQTTLEVDATDNDVIAKVSATADQPGVSVVLAAVDGSGYTFLLTADYDSGPDLTVDVVVTATDAAGNQATVSRPVTLVSAGNCLI